MSIAFTQIRTWASVFLAAALLACGAALVWWGLAPRIDLQAARAERAEVALEDARQMIDLQAGVLAEQQKQVGAVTLLEQAMRELGQTIARNAAAHSHAIEELKRHDLETAEYLRGVVPAVLGGLYARPETTDPTAYTSAHRLPVDAMPIARPGAPAGE